MQPQLLVQSLQGPRAQILIAFLFAGHAMDVEELMTWTGRDRKTHYNHLATLCAAGFLAKQTVAHGRDIYLLGSEMLPALQAWVAQLTGVVPALEGGAPLTQESVKRTSADVVVVVNDLSLNVPTITTLTTTTSSQESVKRTPEEFSKLTAALNQHKITGKKRQELIKCEWVTAEYVDASVEYALDERIWDNPVGIAITRMLDRMDVPEAEYKQKIYKSTTVGNGKRQQTINYTFDIDQEISDFTGHERACGCGNCSMGRALYGDMSRFCPDCKQFNCTCKEQEQGDQP